MTYSARVPDAKIAPNKLGEITNAEKSLERLTRVGSSERVKPFGIEWPAVWWLKWATIHHAFRALEVPQGSTVLDIGSGTGWATLLLAEAGYRPTGVDLAPGNVRISRLHAERWGSPAEFETADMDTLDLACTFDAVLMFDALHHVEDPAAVVQRVSAHLNPGGWALFGEPSLLHLISPDAHRVRKQKGWIENGIGVRALRRWCEAAGMPTTRRFFEPTRPYSDRVRQFGWELIRLVGADVLVAPSYHVWVAARRS
jgi:2-polyprenyl-3-methyl-5-hydroxy-6-metoxy-1,4-benzoquinol methylase